MPFESYRNSRILVTGGAGFIGSHICERLLDTGAEVASILRLTIRELAEKVIKLKGSRSKLVFRPLPQDCPRQRQPGLIKAKATLSWEPEVALEDGLKETIAYFKHSREIA